MGGRLGFNFSFGRIDLPLRAGTETAAAHEVTVGDFNGDGRLDFIVGYFLYPFENRSVPIRIMLQQADGTFVDGAPALFNGNVPGNVMTREIRVADFNGDGVDDAFIADHGYDLPPFPGEPNDLLLSGPTGFSTPTGDWSTVSDFSHSAAVGDIDGDGDIDIMVNNIGSQRPYFLINDGSGGFSLDTARLPAYFENIHPSTSVEFFDFDNDGDLDLFLGSGQLSTWTSVVLVNDGEGDFTGSEIAVPIAFGAPNDVVVDTAVIDFNLDGWDDLVVSVTDYGGSRMIRFLENQGGTGFLDTTSYNLPSLNLPDWAIRIHFADFNGDGYDDMYLARSTENPIFLNDGQGRFYQMTGLWPSFSIRYDLLAPGDFNGDGRIDLAGHHGRSVADGTEYFLVHYNLDTPATQTGDDTTDALMGDNDGESLFGMGGDDLLFGGGGNDYLDGGTGDDYLNGGTGDDIYVVDSEQDTVFELQDAGLDRVESSIGYALGLNLENLTLTGSEGVSGVGNELDNQLFGNAGGNRLTGLGGNDILDGGSNVDTAVVRGQRSAYTVTQTSTGVFQVVGPDGTDTLTAIEFLQFDDQILRLRPGTGVSVNFNTADPSVYQSAMNAIRDFDGNALGGNGSWLRIGSADVNGDGDVDQILVNRTIGRFATIGTAPDGLVYFSDHSWAGETRVAGIYIDPLVASGQVVAGSANDSQRRFQNDLQIENINRVLGANDYDNDGVWEVYFALTDGTAYLRALMHADGNIRYANYQSQQQVIDYLTANGFGPSTWAGWFNQPTSGEAGLGARAENTGMVRTDADSDTLVSGVGVVTIGLQPEAFTPEFYG